MFFVLQVATKFNNIIHKQKYLVYQGALIHERTDQSAVLPPEESCGNRKMKGAVTHRQRQKVFIIPS